MTKRDIFAELVEGFGALKAEREGKITLKKVTIPYKKAERLSAEQVTNIRTKLDVSQQVFARKLRTEVRTIENWEQGRAKPNAQASILLRLVERRPELLEEIASL